MRLLSIMISSLALGLGSVPALAQDDAPPPAGGRGGAGGPGGQGGRPRGEGAPQGRMQQLSPEQLKAAWELQAKHVGGIAGLGEAEVSQLVTAYATARESQRKAMDELREQIAQKIREEGGAGGDGGEGGGEGGGQGGRGGGRGAMAQEMQKATAELNQKERDKLQAAINGFLKPEQTEKVIGPLGAFDRQWDMQTHALADLQLDAAKQTQAMTIVGEYNAVLAKNRDATDRQAAREAAAEARRTMMDEMKKILDEEQFGKFQRSLGGGQRAQGPGGGAGGPGGAGGRRGGGQGGAGGAGGEL